MGGKQFDLRGDGPNYTLKTLNYLDLQKHCLVHHLEWFLWEHWV